jgi:aspartyl-tRNA synthetase
LEVINNIQRPIGKIDVQIKKLSDKNLQNPKYQCELGFLRFCEINIPSVLLILVDTTNEVSYWRLIDNAFLKGLNIKKGKKSITVDVPKNNIIRKGDNSYVEEWIKIIENRREKLVYFDVQKEELQKLQGAYRIISENSDPLLGLEREEFKNIHKFLDNLNMYLDTYFPIIKEMYYNSCWKLGIADGYYS